jgi:hypothetical protein
MGKSTRLAQPHIASRPVENLQNALAVTISICACYSVSGSARIRRVAVSPSQASVIAYVSSDMTLGRYFAAKLDGLRRQPTRSDDFVHQRSIQ